MIDLTTPAFPTTEAHGFNTGMPGMTLRDYFAAKALLAYYSYCNSSDDEFAAKWAYRIADKMMTARKQNETS